MNLLGCVNGVSTVPRGDSPDTSADKDSPYPMLARERHRACRCRHRNAPRHLQKRLRSLYDHHEDWVGERHIFRFRSVHRGQNMIDVPARVVAENPHSQVNGFFEPDAAVPEVAP